MKKLLPFWKGPARSLLLELDLNGGFLVVPSAPSLCQASKDPALWKAHQKADHAVVDSGYLRILLLLAGKLDLPRISGHQLIDLVLNGDESPVPFRQRRLLWVVPDESEAERIALLLNSLGFKPTLQEFYVAPIYQNDSEFQDTALVEIVLSLKPDWIILGIGGGRQEKLGAYLRCELGRRPVVIATGGAISFFSGGQASIPRMMDRLFLGWLIRIIHDPKRFLTRYLGALALPLALLRIRRMS